MNEDFHDDNTNRHFRGQQQTERVLCFFRKHPIVLLRVFLIGIGLVGTLLAGAFLIFTLVDVKESLFFQSILLLLVGISVLMQHVFFLRLLNYFLDIVIITNYRVIDLEKSLFIHDDKEIIDLHEIQDTKKNQLGIIANFLNYGTITIVLPSLSSAMVLHHVPRPEYYLNRINEAKRLYIQERRREKAEEKAKEERQYTPLYDRSPDTPISFDPITETLD